MNVEKKVNRTDDIFEGGEWQNFMKSEQSAKDITILALCFCRIILFFSVFSVGLMGSCSTADSCPEWQSLSLCGVVYSALYRLFPWTPVFGRCLGV